MNDMEKKGESPRINIVVTGMDATGQLYREQVSAIIVEGGQYSFSLLRPLRVRDSVLIEFPATRAGEKPRKIPARVISMHGGKDPASPKEIHLQPEALLDRPMIAPDNAPPAVARPAQQSQIMEGAAPPPTAEGPAIAPQVAPPPAPAEKTSPSAAAQPSARQPIITPAPSAAPLLDAVQASATEAVYRDLLKRLAADAHTISAELGRKLSKELTDHQQSLAAGLSAEAQAQGKLMHARVDELQHLWGSLRATFEKEQAALEQIHTANLESVRRDAQGMVARARSELEKLRTGQEEERHAMQAHLQQTVWDSLSAAKQEVKATLDGLAAAAGEQAQHRVAGLLQEQERAWSERAGAMQGNLRALVARMEAAVQRAESAMQSLQAAAEQAEALAARPPDAGRSASAPSFREEDATMAERIQKSIAAARLAFRESLAEVSRVLENSLQANKFGPIPREEGPRS